MHQWVDVTSAVDKRFLHLLSLPIPSSEKRIHRRRRRQDRVYLVSVCRRQIPINRDAVWLADWGISYGSAVGASRAFYAACEELIIRNGIREIGVCAWNALRGALAVKTSQCLQMSRILWVNFNSCPFAHFQHYWAHQIILSADGDQTTGRDQNNCRATENMN